MQGFNFLRKINDIFSVDAQNHIIDTRTMTDTGQILNQDLNNQILNGTFNPYTVAPYTGIASGTASGTGLGRMFSGLASNLKNPNKPLIGGSFKLPNIGKAAATLREKPIMEGGPSVGTTARGLGALYYGGKALKGIYENSLAQDDLDSLRQDIRAQVVSNPMYSMYMDASDEKLLRQMNNGTSTEGISNAAEGAMKGLPKATIAAILGGLTGGVGGAAIGGIGSLVNSGIEGYGKGMADQQSKLQGLYGRLKQADEEYRQMKRPAGLRRAGLSTQYFNQLY